MNASDRLQYYETFYDSFCSEFAIPRAHTCKQFDLQRCRSNGKLSDNVYYFDTFSDAFPSSQQEEDQRKNSLVFSRFHQSDPNFYLDYYKDNQFSVPHHLLDEADDFSQPYCSVSFFQSTTKKKGPTPPPKPPKVKQIAEYHPPPPPPPPIENVSRSIPDFFQEMELTRNSSPVGEGGKACRPSRFFHQSFESIASCPVPPPPKFIKAPNRHMSVERLPPYATTYDPNPNTRKLSQPHVNRDPMSLSEFLKLTSNNVFRRPPFGSRKPSAASLLPCGHMQNSSGNATSSAPSPSPSASSAGEGSQSRSKKNSVLTFRKKCSVTKRRKKIDESLFVPSSCEVLSTSSQNKNNSNTNAVHHPAVDKNESNHTNSNSAFAAESFHYSITNADSPTHSIMMMAETNHDTEFELDPLPEKNCDDVLDFTWTLSPVDEMEADGSSRKKTARKPTNSSPTAAGGNGRPSSRCSLIINSLMGHLSGLTKTTQEQPQESHRHHEHSPNTRSSNNNNNFAHLLDHRHNHYDGHHQHHHSEDPRAPDEYDDHQKHNPAKKFDTKRKASKAKEKKASPISDNFTASVTSSNSHNNHTNPQRDLHPNDNDCGKRSSQLKPLGNKRDQQKRSQRSSSSEMVLMTTATTSSSGNKKTYQSQHNNGTLVPSIPSSSQPQAIDARHSHFMGNSTAKIQRRPRSLAAFNLDIDAVEEEHSCQQRKIYPAREENCKSGSKSLGNIDKEEMNRHNDSIHGFGNVIGCIPRVSLSNIKAKQQHQCSSGYHSQQQQQHHHHELKPKFVVGGSSSSGGNHASCHHHVDQPYHTFHETNNAQRTCSGLFCADDDCCCEDDKYDKYYGQYSLTGLNIPMLASASSLSSTSQPHNNNNKPISAAKSAEELVLDRYYAHCNKIVRSKPILSPPAFEKENKKKKSGKRTVSIPEKIWKNVSLPLISSTNNGNNNNGSSLLCDHHKAKQIEECIYCINEQEQQRTHFNQHKSSRASGRRRKTTESLFQLEHATEESRNHHHHPRGVRDLLGNSNGARSEGREGEQLIKLKKVSTGNNKIISGQKLDRNVNRFDQDVIGELSSSSLSSFTTTAAVSVHTHEQRLKRNSKKQHKKCVQHLSTSEEETCDDEEDDRKTATTVVLGMQAKRKSFSCDNFIRAEEDDYDTDEGQGQLAVKVKTGGLSSKRREISGVKKRHHSIAVEAAGELRRRRKHQSGNSNRNNNSKGFCARVSRSAESIINECELQNDHGNEEYEDDGLIPSSVKSSRGDRKVHLAKLKRSQSGNGGKSTAMNPALITGNEKVIIEDGNSSSSTIGSLPTSQTSSSSSHRQDHDQSNGKESKTPGTKNRVKWTFLTSGLAKATRKLSSGSSRSSLNSFTTTSSDSGASSKKEDSSESTSTSSSCASSGIEVGRKTGKNKSSSSTIIKTTFLGKQGARNDHDAEKLKNKSDPRKGTDVKRRNTAEVFFNDGKTSISNSNAPKNVHHRHKSSLLPNRTASLRRRPSYNAKKQRPFTVQAVPSSVRKIPVPGQAGVISSTTPSVFLRKPLRFPHLTRVVSAPVDSTHSINNIFSAFSNTSCTSSGSNSTSGYTSNVSRRTSEFLKSFRKRWAKKNNKVADGDEEDATRSTHNKDDDDDEDNVDENDGNVLKDNNQCHYLAHETVQNNTGTPFGGTVNRLSLVRKKRRNSSRASKQAIFSTFYIGPAIKDPMEEEKIYVTKDFDDVVLDLQSGQVKKTCDGSVLFTADPRSFAAKNKLKKKSKRKKDKNQEVHPPEKSRKDLDNMEINNARKSGDNSAKFFHSKKNGERKNGKSGAETTARMVMMPSASSKKSHRMSGGSGGFIKRGFGISKDFLVGVGTAANFKNQSVDDICGSEADPENAPDTPTRNGILGRLRDSSRSGFGSRSSSKKRGSSKHDTVNTGGFEVSQTDSPLATQKTRNSLSDSVGARGNTDDANDQGLGVSAKLSTGHNHQPSCSSEEELTSINSCENRLSSLTLGGGGSDGWEGEYNGPFQGRAVATVDSEPSPYDRQALRYKKGDIIEIISMKRSGLWKGKVNNQIGSFKWMNVKLLPDPSSSSAENYDGDRNQRRVGGEEDEENDEDAEEDEVIDGDDSVGDYADTSNYQCSLHYNSHANAAAAIAGVGEECSCPPPPRGRRNDPQHHHQNPGARQYRGNSKRLAAALTPWDVDAVEQRQSVANVINGYGGIGSSNKDKRSKERGMYHGDPLGIMNADEDEDDGNEEGEDVENDEEIEDEDEEVSEEDESLEVGNGDGMPKRAQSTDKDVKCQKSKSAKNGATKKTGQEIDGRKHKSVVGKGQPKTVGDLLQRINLEKYTLELEKHGFESLDLLKELEEEDLDKIGITDEADRTKILTAVELLREWDNESDRIPGPTYYQHRYYLTTQKTPKARPVAAGGGSQTLGVVNPNNKSSRITGQQQQGSPAQIQQQGHTTTNAGMPSPHFYRLHHPRDSGIFVGKVDGEEDGDEPISGADLSCAESHPDAETEEIILSPINLQKTSSVGVAGGGGAASGNPSAPWHSQNHHNNNNKQGSHHHINRFISKGAPAGIVPSSNNTSSSTNPTNSSAGSGPVQTAQQPTSSASSSGSSSSSSGITTTGDSFWNSVSSSNNSNGSSSASSGDGPGTSSIVVDQNHSQWTKQQQTRDHPASSNTHQHRKRDSSPAYNTDSVRNRFLQAKSLFEPSNNCSGGSGSASVAAATTTTAVGGKPARAPGHVYENGGAVVVEGDGSGSGIMKSQTHQLHLQRGDSQGKSLSQQQNRFLYCEKSSDSGISVCTNSPPPLRNEFRN